MAAAEHVWYRDRTRAGVQLGEALQMARGPQGLQEEHIERTRKHHQGRGSLI